MHSPAPELDAYACGPMSSIYAILRGSWYRVLDNIPFDLNLRSKPWRYLIAVSSASARSFD
eukprot:5578399-Pyramimonas_sp.AAC.1